MKTKKQSDNKIDPIDESIDKELNPHIEKTNVELKRCEHKNVKLVDGEIRCSCGAGWSGKNIQRLYEEIQNQK